MARASPPTPTSASGESEALTIRCVASLRFKPNSSAATIPRQGGGRCQQFFIALQQSGHDWLFLGTTKTGLVYRLKGNPPQSHE